MPLGPSRSEMTWPDGLRPRGTVSGQAWKIHVHLTQRASVWSAEVAPAYRTEAREIWGEGITFPRPVSPLFTTRVRVEGTPQGGQGRAAVFPARTIALPQRKIR